VDFDILRFKISKYIIRLIEFLVFFDFWVILAISIWGSVEYRLIHIAGTYFKADTVFRPVCVLAFFLLILKFFKKKSIFEFLSDIFKNPINYVVLVLIIYTSLAVPVYLQTYFKFEYGNAQDFAARHHAIYNTIIGNFMRSDIFPYLMPFKNWNYLGDNFSIILLLIAPIYWIFKNGAFLVVFQSVSLIIGSIAVFLIARNKLKNSWTALLIFIAYLLYPLIVKFPFHDFRQEYVAIPLLLFTFYNLQNNNIGKALVCLFGVALTREAGWLAVAMIAIYIFFCSSAMKNHRLIGLFIFIVSIAMCYFLIEYYLPKHNQLGFYGYSPLGGKQKLLEMFSSPQLLFCSSEPDRRIFFVQYFKCLGYIPLFSSMILLALPFLLQNWLTDIIATVVHIWHSTFIIPFLFVSLIYAVYYFNKIFRKSSFIINIWLGCFILFNGGIVFYDEIVCSFLNNRLYINLKPKIYNEYQRAEKYLQKHKSVFTHFALLPNMTNREKLYWRSTMPVANDINTDYLFLSPPLLVTDPSAQPLINDVIKFDRYLAIYSTKNFIVMAKKEKIEIRNKIVSDFSDINEVKLWTIDAVNTKYKVNTTKEGSIIKLEFNGNEKEDEFIQMKRVGLDIDLEEYPYFYISYGIGDIHRQTIEMVFGIDTNGDRNVDFYVDKNFISKKIKKGEYAINVFDAALKYCMDAHECNVREIILYPHKSYGINCAKTKAREYNFNINKLGFYSCNLKKNNE